MAQKTLHDLDLRRVLYDERFLASHVGKLILNDPKVAIVELLANSWDAGATQVDIQWPQAGTNQPLVVSDNGIGMTDAEFNRRWRTLNYNRQEDLGDKVVFPEGSPCMDRFAFGRNGVGRWASFCFGDSFTVDTRKVGFRNKYRVEKGIAEPFLITTELADQAASDCGTRIAVENPRRLILNADQIRNEIGMRFLTDPNFLVKVNEVAVTFDDIREANIQSETLTTSSGHTIELIIINTQSTDHTARQHGIAWHVRGRLVGTCSWEVLGKHSEDLVIDQRRVAARRFTFIVKGDHLASSGAVKADWTEFDVANEAFLDAADAVYRRVNEYILSSSEEDRRETMHNAKQANREQVSQMSPLEREAWVSFVDQAQIACPSIRDTDIVKLSTVVANLEQSKSRYSLLSKLSQYGPDQLDQLNELLEQWTLGMAKEVLDEIAKRLRLIEQLQARFNEVSTREVQDLQPLFEKGLWIFGPEFETIEYTSNVGMARVVHNLFKKETKASQNRPDFAVLPDGTSGLYSMPSYDSDFGERGVERLVIIELKKPGVAIGDEQKAQTWKYVKELFTLGHLQEGRSSVRCFVLGAKTAAYEDKEREELARTVVISPILFDTVLTRAKSRMLKLHERVKGAPFLDQHRQEIEDFLAPESSNLL